MNKQNKAFTLAELTVTIIIITILASIWFYSYVWYISEARDAERMSDMWILTSSLKIYKQNKWWYPKPGDAFNITNNWTTIVYQWKMNKWVTLSSLDKLPYDPYKEQEYVYSSTKNKQEAQVAMTLENWDFPSAFIAWDFTTVAYNVLPTIILAMDEAKWTNVEIDSGDTDWAINRQKFILNNWLNLPYSITAPFDPVYWYTSTDLWTVLLNWDVDHWQNSSYSSCIEISDAWKSIWDWEYQILDDTSTLVDIDCTF